MDGNTILSSIFFFLSSSPSPHIFSHFHFLPILTHPYPFSPPDLSIPSSHLISFFSLPILPTPTPSTRSLSPRQSATATNGPYTHTQNIVLRFRRRRRRIRRRRRRKRRALSWSGRKEGNTENTNNRPWKEGSPQTNTASIRIYLRRKKVFLPIIHLSLSFFLSFFL